MKVFISWSGIKSHEIATIFRDWLPFVIQSVVPYVSSEDIDKGARWSTDIARELEDSTFGILCVTKDNIEAPWLSFEAGALSKTMDKSFVCPFLYDMKRSEVNGPILQFQSTIFSQSDILKLMKSLNKACAEFSIPEDRLVTAFDVWYPTLEKKLNEVKEKYPEQVEAISNSSVTETLIYEEILELSRDNQKLLRNTDANVVDNLEKLNSILSEFINRNDRKLDFYEKKSNRKYKEVILDEFLHGMFFKGDSPYGLLLVLGLYKDEYPWLYDMGRYLIDTLQSSKSIKEKKLAFNDFERMLDLTCQHPMFINRINNSKILNDLPYLIHKYMENLEFK